MLLNIKTGWNGIPRRENREIIVLVSSIAKLAADHLTFLFTDRHAYLVTAQFFSDPADLDQIDWPLLRNRDFRRDPGDPGKLERYQAEALVHRHLPNEAMLGIVCYDGATQAWLQTLVASHRPPLVVVSRPGWYFR